MKKLTVLLVGFLVITGFAFANGSKESASSSAPAELTIATVNNPDMVIMQKLSPAFTKETGIKLNWVVMPENQLRQKVTEDVGLGSGKYDIVTIGTYDTPFWAKNKWISSLEPYFNKMTQAQQKAYDRADLLKPIRSALSYQNSLYALPFYGESSMIFYRKDLFAKAGLTMPEHPTWQQIYDFAVKLNDPSKGFYGIALRGLPGWGENMAVFDTMVNAFGARWYDMNWHPQFNTPQMKNAWQFYKKIITTAGEPSPTTYGYTECLALMESGKAAMWYDATVSAGTLQSKNSKVAGKIGYALAPTDVLKGDTGWLWSWALGIESASKNKEAAFKFITWATNEKYLEMVGKQIGWAQVPPGTRYSLYKNPNYVAAAPFAKMVLQQIEGARYDNPTVQSVPYKGVQYISIPEFQSLGTQVAQTLAAYLAGKQSLDNALASAQSDALKTAKQGGYYKQ